MWINAWINTLDIDKDPTFPARPSADREFVDYITKRIKRCKNLLRIEVKPSLRKGYHVTLYCKVQCDLCRLVFDDFERYRRDINRKYIHQNVLFDNCTVYRAKNQVKR